MLAERVLDTPVAGPGLLGEIEAVLAAGGVRLAEVSAFAVGLGPGAFTSLRVGLATVKGLAYALERGVSGVRSLEALALRARTVGQVGTPLVAPILDARRGELYSAAFDAAGVCVLDERARAPEALGEELRALGAAVTGVGGGAAAFAARLGIPCLDDARLRAPQAAELAALAEAAWPAGISQGATLAALAPLYIRPADAQVNPKFAVLAAPGA